MTNRMVNYRRVEGFSLVELIVVMLTLSIIAVFAAPRWIGTTPSLYAQNQQLLSDIRYTQSLSMSTGKRYRLNLNTPNSYSITDISGTAVPNPSTGANSVTLASNINFGSFTNLPNSLIAFDERGIPYTNATATTALLGTATILLTSSGVNRSIQITPGTGNALAQ